MKSLADTKKKKAVNTHGVVMASESLKARREVSLTHGEGILDKARVPTRVPSRLAFKLPHHIDAGLRPHHIGGPAGRCIAPAIASDFGMHPATPGLKRRRPAHAIYPAHIGIISRARSFCINLFRSTEPLYGGITMQSTTTKEGFVSHEIV